MCFLLELIILQIESDANVSVILTTLININLSHVPIASLGYIGLTIFTAPSVLAYD